MVLESYHWRGVLEYTMCMSIMQWKLLETCMHVGMYAYHTDDVSLVGSRGSVLEHLELGSR